MKKLTFSLLFVFIIFSVSQAQVAINADGASANPKAMLDIQSNSKGLLIPRMTTAERETLFNSLTDTEIGMLVFDTDVNFFFVYMGGGLAHDSKKLASGAISLLEDEDGDTKIEVERTADDDTIRFSTAGSDRFKMSKGLLEMLNTNSIHIGEKAGNGTTNLFDIAIGYKSLHSNTSGTHNVGLGYSTLYSNTEGEENVAIGNNALKYNTVGDENTAVGHNALAQATSGFRNTAIGNGALSKNLLGDLNVAIGKDALLNFNSENGNNIAIGAYAAENLTVGYNNIIIGTGLDAPNATGSRQMYIGGVLYGDLLNKYIGIGTTSPDEKLHVYESGNVSSIIESGNGVASLQIKGGGIGNSSVTFYESTDTPNKYGGSIGYHSDDPTTDDPDKNYLYIYEGGNFAFKNGSIGVGTVNPLYKLHVNGDICPVSHHGGDLGKTGLAWGNVWAQSYTTQGSAAFTDRSVTSEILLYPPKPKKEGDFDYKTESGLEELDPNSLPSELKKDYGILIDEMATYNYKANYEQQVQIEELKKLVEVLVSENKSLQKKVKRIEKRVRSKK